VRGAIGLDAPGGEARDASGQGCGEEYRSKHECAVGSQWITSREGGN
jgi:hypothetical protein